MSKFENAIEDLKAVEDDLRRRLGNAEAVEDDLRRRLGNAEQTAKTLAARLSERAAEVETAQRQLGEAEAQRDQAVKELRETRPTYRAYNPSEIVVKVGGQVVSGYAEGSSIEVKPDSAGLTIRSLVVESFNRSKRKGWYGDGEEPEDRNVPEMLALIHSEISEALEAYRDTSYRITLFHRVSPDGGHFLSEYQHQEQNKASENRPWKPDGFPIELADAVIRIADLCGYLGIDLEKAIRVKSDFNETRPIRHGGKRC